MKRLAAVVVCIVVALPARADVYDLPPEGHDVIGALSTIVAAHEDTMIDLARRHGLGYEDMVRANPHVNVWVPGEGTEIILPTRFVLPPGPREGIVLNLAEYRMYYFPAPAAGEQPKVHTYPISIGRMDWATPLGRTKIVAMAKNPTWYPPESVREEHAAEGEPLPRVVPPGPDNPLGSRAIRLGIPGYLIHGTNRPAGLGMRVSHGCIRMFPEDVEFLFDRVRVNTPVRIVDVPVKMGWQGDELVIEVHPLLEASDVEKDLLTHVTEQFVDVTELRRGILDWDQVEALVSRSNGIPESVGEAVRPPAGPEIENAATSAAFD